MKNEWIRFTDNYIWLLSSGRHSGIFQGGLRMDAFWQCEQRYLNDIPDNESEEIDEDELYGMSLDHYVEEMLDENYE